MVIAKLSYLYLAHFNVPLRKDDYCSTPGHLDLTTLGPATTIAAPATFTAKQYQHYPDMDPTFGGINFVFLTRKIKASARMTS